MWKEGAAGVRATASFSLTPEELVAAKHDVDRERTLSFLCSD